jgi:hypothetical protein
MPDDKDATKMVPAAPHQSVEISRRNLLGSAMIVAGGAAVLAGAVTATRAEAENAETGKLLQATAGYRTSPKNGQRCADCAYFIEPSSCNLVSGTISRVGWCKFYLKKG